MGTVCSKGDNFQHVEVAADAEVFWKDPRKLAVVEECCAFLEQNPHVVMDIPELECIRQLLQAFGVSLENPDEVPPPKFPKILPRQVGNEDIAEEDVDDDEEINDSDRWPVDVLPFPEQAPEHPAGLASPQQQSDLEQRAHQAFEAQQFTAALTLYTEAIMLRSPTALLYAKRAEVLLKLKRPRAGIEDCNAALAINPDAGKAFRLRGIAWRHLGNWSEAHKDLAMGQQLDYDENIHNLQQFVEERYQKIRARENRRRLLGEQHARSGARRAVAAWIYESQNLGLLPANFNGEILLMAVHEDPDIQQKLGEEHVLNALHSIMINPRAFTQYQNDDDVMKLVHLIIQGLVVEHSTGH